MAAGIALREPAGMRIGRLELIPLTDAVGTLGRLDAMFPGVPADAWAPHRRRHPSLFDGPSWRLRFGCFLILAPGAVVLVDTGVGPPGGAFLPERQGRLPAELRRHGLEPGDVDIVFLTHLHVDHVGWNVDERGAPTFPRARYVTHEEGQGCAPGRTAPLAEAGALDVLDGEAELVPGVTAFPTPGHLPGHMSLRLEARAVILGDVAVHPAQLAEPEWRYVDDEDGAASVETRRALLGELAADGTLIACGHYPGSGIGHLRPDGAWEALQLAK